MMQTIDARGLSCPQPVIMTQQALAAAPAECTVLIDNRTAVENVTRFAEYAGYRVHCTDESTGDFRLRLEK